MGAGGMTDHSTLAMLRRRYGSVCIPIEQVRKDYLPHLGTVALLLRRIREGRIQLRICKADWGGRPCKVVYMHDLAEWIDSFEPERENRSSV
ncbi:pyocin activator PrtN family protein [Stutzerimonas stutzeri]|uniref:pyocin activator PrtN family protein n=2 Tax=Stutzerimonas stutzeri TaxID=316 RepID=UPI000C9D105C|nr:hypothetical protein CXK97_14715 [Stutzerimonas stutzeri]